MILLQIDGDWSLENFHLTKKLVLYGSFKCRLRNLNNHFHKFIFMLKWSILVISFKKMSFWAKHFLGGIVFCRGRKFSLRNLNKKKTLNEVDKTCLNRFQDCRNDLLLICNTKKQTTKREHLVFWNILQKTLKIICGWPHGLTIIPKYYL